MKSKIKKIDSVQLMRSIREKLSKKYSMHPELEKEDLKKNHQKYKLGAQKRKLRAA